LVGVRAIVEDTSARTVRLVGSPGSGSLNAQVVADAAGGASRVLVMSGIAGSGSPDPLGQVATTIAALGYRQVRADSFDDALIVEWRR
jgi:hypothetical protein